MTKFTGLLTRMAITSVILAGSMNMYAQQNKELFNAQLQKEKSNNSWLDSDISEWQITDQYTEEATGITHAYLQQMHSGIPVYNAISIYAIQKQEIIYFYPGLIPHLQEKVNADKPKLTPVQAIEAAARHLEITLTGAPQLAKSDARKNEFEYSIPGIDRSNVKVRLVYQPVEGQVMLAWDVSMELQERNHWWNIRVDAVKGNFLDKNDFVAECNFGPVHHDHESELFQPVPSPSPLPPPPVPAEYTVYPFPIEAPSFGSLSLLSGPSDNIASPFGWHDDNGVTGAEYTITRGNNVHAYEDANNDNLPGYSPNSGTLQFNYPVDLTQAPLANQDASITNLFYDCNRIHDVLYHAGFTEAAGNFQQNNYGNGGLGNDYVKAEAFDGSGTNNANFSTPSDGASGRMQMYLWTAPTPDRDGSFDNGIVAHEYGHGLSNRLTGGPSQAGCLGNAEQGGEGWSDWLALMMTTEPSDIPTILTQARGIGTYALNQATTGQGIRRFRYSVNMAINPQTYADLATSGTGPHNKGEIWCDAIWDMSCFLMNDFGFSSDPTVATAGNNIAMRLVLEGMKLQPCSPGYIDGRDAILLADQTLYGNAHRCRIWEAFARRGMGFGASQGSSSSSTDQTVSFAIPTFCLVATQPPVAGFTQNTTTVSCAGTVAFTDTSLQPFSWLWNFGDLTTSTLQNPTHVYNAPGTYTVSLQVTNPLGTNTITQVNLITVSPTFTVTATATPAAVCLGNPVSLSGNGTGSNNVTYTVNSIPYAPLTGSGTTLTLADDVISTIQPIGFTFSFYGQNYTNFYVGSNGFITFSSGQSASVIYGPAIPSASSPNNLIALAWNDLYPPDPSSVVDYFNTGVSPNKKLVIRYNTRHYGGAAYPFVVQAILSEGSNEIEIHTTTITNAAAFDPGATTTQGIENQNGTKATIVPGRNAALFSASNDAYRFVPAVSYSYTWSPGSLSGASQTVTPAASGAYTVSVGDGSGCVISASSPVVTVNPLPTPSVSGTLAFCAGSSTVLDAGAYSGYSWSTGASTQTIPVNTAGTFTVTVTDGNGCSGSVSATTSVNALPTPSISGVLSFCAGNSTTLDAGSHVAYSWSTGATIQTISVNTAGTYTVSVTDANGCTGSASVIAAVNALPTPSISGTLSFCSGSSTILDAGAYSTYSWTNATTNSTITVNSAGTFGVTVTDGNGCTGSTSVTTTLNALPTPSITGNLAFCLGNSTTLDAGSYSGYSWSTGASSQTIFVNTAGTFTVTVTDANGCSGSASVSTTTNGGITPAISQSSVSCSGTAILLDAGAGYTNYSWSTSSTVQTITANTAGLYTVTVTNGSGCSGSVTVNVTLHAPLTVSGNVTSLACKGVNTGSITVNPSQGTAPYTYLWNNGSTNQTRSSLYSNTFVVTVTDANGCTKKSSFFVSQPATSLLVNNSKTNVRCFGLSTGKASVAASGGTPPYSYAWNTIPAQTTAAISGLAAGVYTCVITDASNCVKSSIITITEPADMIVVQSQLDVTILGGNNGIASVSVSGGTAPYTYSWKTIPVQTTSTITGLVAGTYKCTVTDAKGCTKKVTFVIVQPGAKVATNTNTDQMTVFPNPTNGQLNLYMNSQANQPVSITMENLSGQVIYKQSGSVVSGENQIRLDLQGYAKGMYFLKLQCEQSVFIERIVVQ